MKRDHHLPTVAFVRSKRSAIKLLGSPRHCAEQCALDCSRQRAASGHAQRTAVANAPRPITPTRLSVRLLSLRYLRSKDTAMTRKTNARYLWGRTLIWSLAFSGFPSDSCRRHGVMRHSFAASSMDQTDIRGLGTTVHRSVIKLPCSSDAGCRRPSGDSVNEGSSHRDAVTHHPMPPVACAAPCCCCCVNAELDS